MNTPTLALLGVVAVMASNQLVMRVGGLRSRPAVFWGLQLINLGFGTWVLAFGLPGWDLHPVVSWILGLLFLFRVIQNNYLRARYLRAAQEGERRERKHKVDALTERLAASRAAAEDEG